MKDLIEEWKSKKDGAKINAKKKVLSLAKQKAKEINNKANQVHEEVFYLLFRSSNLSRLILYSGQLTGAHHLPNRF